MSEKVEVPCEFCVKADVCNLMGESLSLACRLESIIGYSKNFGIEFNCNHFRLDDSKTHW